jgi:hypothetical protein
MESKLLDYLTHLASFQFLVSYNIRNLAKQGKHSAECDQQCGFIRGHDAVDHTLDSIESVTTKSVNEAKENLMRNGSDEMIVVISSQSVLKQLLEAARIVTTRAQFQTQVIL